MKSFNDKRRRERKQPKLISWSNQQKKSNNNNNFAREAHFFIHFFFAVVLHDHNVKLGQKLPSYKFYGENVVCVPVPFFSLPLIFTLVAASISHFLTSAITFSPYSSNKIGLLCFLSLALALSLLCTSMQTLKLSRKKKIGFVVVILLSLKVWVAIRFTAEKREGSWNTKFHPGLHERWTYVRTILREPKFLGFILWDNQIFLPMVLRCALLAREGAPRFLRFL